MLASLSKLRGLLERPAHTYRATIETFPNLDVEAIAKSMDLVTLGKQRGQANEPSSADPTLDAVEAKIVEQVATEQKRAHGELEDRLADFRQRLIDLDFESHFSGIKDVAQGGLADLKAEHQMGLDDLHGVRGDHIEAENYHKAFKGDHRLKRPAKITNTLWTVLKWLLIVLLFIGELVANGYYLARGDELGLAGGIIQALLFSALNVGVPVLLGLKGLPFLFHRNFLAKLFGLFWLAFFLAGSAILNLGLAHYREVGAESIVGAGLKVMDRMFTRPLVMDDFQSWVLFSLGVLFSTIALLDGLALKDRYPGYQGASDGLRKARDNYASMRRQRIQDLLDVRQEYQDAVAELRSDLTKRRTEHEAIVAHRSRQLILFREHQNQLERSANALLRAYRDSNLQARTSAAPDRFNQPFELQRIEVHVTRDNEWNSDELKGAITGAQSDLEAVMRALTQFFDDALKSYRELDNLAPGT